MKYIYMDMDMDIYHIYILHLFDKIIYIYISNLLKNYMGFSKIQKWKWNKIIFLFLIQLNKIFI